jgi:carbamoyl-phosphate synthase large subunit
MKDKKVILITSIGKRVQLINHLKKNFKIIGVDAGDTNAGKYFVDEFYKIPKATQSDYICSLLKICVKEKVDLLVPLYEGEFEILNLARKQFEEIQVKVILSSSKVVEFCKDKRKTAKYFESFNIKNPKIYDENDVNAIIKSKDVSKFPLFIKPEDGMGSSDAFKINNIKELEFFKEYISKPIIQNCIIGEEYTVDCLVDLKGKPIYMIPRVRMEVRSGEVVKSRTVRDMSIIDEADKVIKALNELKDENNNGAIGPLTIQFFKTTENEIYLLEINPRFGGGVPLSFECGADYGKALVDMLENTKIDFENTFEIKTMLRFDDAIYID